jgi:TolB-like protein
MVEDVISALYQGVNVRVLGATATAMFNRAAFTDLAALGRQLGVRYLLPSFKRSWSPKWRPTSIRRSTVRR